MMHLLSVLFLVGDNALMGAGIGAGLAAIGAGIGAGIYSSYADAFSAFKPAGKVEPANATAYDELYAEWRSILLTQLNQSI